MEAGRALTMGRGVGGGGGGGSSGRSKHGEINWKDTRGRKPTSTGTGVTGAERCERNAEERGSGKRGSVEDINNLCSIKHF